MKLCVLTHLFPARSETFVYEHVIGMQKSGYQVSVIAREVGEGITGRELEQLDELGIKRHYVGSYRRGLSEMLGLARAVIRSSENLGVLVNPEPWPLGQMLLDSDIQRLIRSLAPDLLHIHFATLAARLERTCSGFSDMPPTVVTWHGYDANVIPRAMGPDVYSALFATEIVHTVGSRFMRERLADLGTRKEYVKVIAMGVDLEKFSYRAPRSFRSEEPLRVISVGRLDEMKGHGYLIEAIGELVRRRIAVNLRIVGDGPLRSALKEQIVQGGLQGNIELLGSMPSNLVAAEMSEADLFALACIESSTGRVETQGVVFAEAQAMGLPVVACDVGGVADSLVNGESGTLCPPGDWRQLADAIEYFSQNRKSLESYGKKGRKFVEQQFSLDTMIQHFEEIYAALLSST